MSRRSRRLIGSLVLLILICSLSGCFLIREKGDGPVPAYRSASTLSGVNGPLREPFGIAVRAGSIYISDGEAGSILKLAEDGTTSVVAGGLKTPSAIAFLADGDLVVADTGSHTIKRIASDGAITTLAGTENTPGSGDGAAAAATFNGPIGIAVSEKDGGIYVADTYNDRIRLIRDGQVSTIAGSTRGFADGSSLSAKFDSPLGLAVWQDKLLVADSGNARIRVVEPNGEVWTLAGSGGDGELRNGWLTQATFAVPTAITTDGDRIFVADDNAIRVIGRRVFPFVETISDERRGYADGPASRSRFNRPSGLAIGVGGALLIADSDNGSVRVISDGGFGREVSHDEIDSRRITAGEFRELQPPRWPYDPPMNAREVAGTLGEIRGEVGGANKSNWFHNGLDIAGAYGETAKFIRTETVLDPHSAQNFGTSRELLRLPAIGYIHLRLGRDKDDNPLGDRRFQFERDGSGKLKDVRVPRGARFNAGDMLGTLNSMNHVHLIAGRSGAEMNALDALVLPGIGDSIAPVIERVEMLNEDWRAADGVPIRTGEKRRVVVDAYDRMDGNAERRRLGVYRLGYQVLSAAGPITDIDWTIVFARMPSNDAVRFAYAPGSRSGATGETKFRYVVSNRVDGDGFSEGFFDSANLGPGIYTLRAYAEDYFGNTASKDLKFEIAR
jgi:DNA-binding beta-propeller fold protein YncE